jgi:hypothetical protein
MMGVMLVTCVVGTVIFMAALLPCYIMAGLGVHWGRRGWVHANWGALFGLTVIFLPKTGNATLTASEIMRLAQQQLSAPAEFARGEMKIYRHDRLERTYTFVLGRQWDAETHTESVRVDFRSAVSLELGDTSRYADNRYLLRRMAQEPPTQWIYMPALRRVRIAPYRPAERVLSSHFFFYDLTWSLALGDFRYQFATNSPSEQTPIIEGEPQASFVPYPHSRIALEKREDTYLITEMTVGSPDDQRTVRFADFLEVSPGYYRPKAFVWTSADGRTELTFQQWSVSLTSSNSFMPTQLETRPLAMPETK